MPEKSFMVWMTYHDSELDNTRIRIANICAHDEEEAIYLAWVKFGLSGYEPYAATQEDASAWGHFKPKPYGSLIYSITKGAGWSWIDCVCATVVIICAFVVIGATIWKVQSW